MLNWSRSAALALLISLSACSPQVSVTSRSESDAQASAPEPAAAPAAASGSASADTAAAEAPTFKITILGDSLTAGIGLRTDDAYPTLVQKRFTTDGYRVEIVNAGIIGQTTADGVRQLEEVLEPDVRILVVALGSNDALRGISLDQTRQNLATIVETARARNAAVLLAGMEPPTSLGTDYQQAFRGLFIRLSSEYKEGVVYLPSMLDGVLGNPALNQEDGVRPNAEGAKVIAQTIFGKLQVMVDGMGGGS